MVPNDQRAARPPQPLLPNGDLPPTRAMSSARLSLAMCQIHTEEWDLDGNVMRALDALREAKRRGAELAVCPECMIHAYPIGRGDARQAVNARTREVAERLGGERVGRIRSLARELSLHVVFGFAERGTGDEVHNSAVWIKSDGQIGNIYRKVHCRPFESVWFDGCFTPGDTFSVYPLETNGNVFQLGTIICFDRERPETFLCLRHMGVELIICPLATDTEDIARSAGKHSNESLTQAMAACSECYIVVVNHSGRFNGGSFIVDPNGDVLRQMGREPGVDLTQIDIGALRRKRRDGYYGWRGYGFSRLDVYSRCIPKQLESNCPVPKATTP